MKKNLSTLKTLISILIVSSLTITPVYAMSNIDGLGGAGAGAHRTTQTVSDAGAATGSQTETETEAEPATDTSTGTDNGTQKTQVGCTIPGLQDSLSDTIKEGIFAGNIDLSNMSGTEATTAVNNYISGIGNADITLNCVSGNTVTVKASEMGLSWNNTGIINEALSLGHSGNVIKRFKELSDLKSTNKVFDIEIGVDESKIKNIVTSKCQAFDVKAQDATISRADGKFNIVPGNDGMTVNVDESVALIKDYMTTQFKGEPATLDMAVEVSKPKGDTDTLSSLTDVLGTFTTKFTNSGSDRVTNVANGCRLINGTLLYPGEQISVSETISPMTEENGYALAGSYMNGMVVESFGGGICQVSTTLYQAVLRAELQVDERYNHSMVVNYVDHSGDAAIAEGIKDFKFTNNLENPVYIDGYTSPDKTITFTIYGIETRPANRTLEFESVDLETMEPAGEKVVADSSEPAGYTRRQSAHIGYKSELYKIVKVDGVETDRVLINKSTYNAVPATLTVGTATSDPTVKAALESAIATQSIDYCKAIASGSVPAVSADPTAIALAQAAAAQAAAQPAADQAATDQAAQAAAQPADQAATPEATPEQAQQ